MPATWVILCKWTFPTLILDLEYFGSNGGKSDNHSVSRSKADIRFIQSVPTALIKEAYCCKKNNLKFQYQGLHSSLPPLPISSIMLDTRPARQKHFCSLVSSATWLSSFSFGIRSIIWLFRPVERQRWFRTWNVFPILSFSCVSAWWWQNDPGTTRWQTTRWKTPGSLTHCFEESF